MSIDALGHLGEIIIKTGQGKKFIFLDFDGTISNLVNDPDSAAPVAGAIEVLKKAVKIKDCLISILSGRNISDLGKYFPINELILCGNHGAEIEGQGINYRHALDFNEKKSIDELAKKVREAFGEIPGVFIENKTYAAAVHYRKTWKNEALKIEKWFETLEEEELHDVRIRKGKKVFEILPKHSFGKADAIKMIVGLLGDKEKSNGIVFAGDDATDTEAFSSMGNSAVKIFIGENPPQNADYTIENPDKMVVFIKELAEMLGTLYG